ncbi:MAG: DUF59 domain-containing protein [Flavobacteriales bacterium]|jgi:FeS assembly SUF system protein|nr:DUF59 domain-containing protein [Flavobacteriales bacterium]
MDKKQLEDTIIEVIKTVYDPEIPVDVFEMGLIYEIKIDNEANVQIIMTLTSPSCPVAESLPQEVKDKVGGIEAVKSAEIELTFEPAWEKDMMSEEALLELGMM